MNKHFKNSPLLFTLILLGQLCSYGSIANAATLGLEGHYRVGGSLFNNLDHADGTRPGLGNTTGFVENRLLLQPTVRVDDRFSFRSEMVVGQTQSQAAYTSSRHGWNLGSMEPIFLHLDRAWMEWASDWGIFRVGRMPKAFGLGVLYHAGDHFMDDWGSTADRVSFQALLGNIGLNVGFEKAREGNPHAAADDIDAYELLLDYTNPEAMFDAGLLWTRSIVANPGAYHRQGSAHDLSLFAVKKFGQIQLGAEFVSTRYDSGSTQNGLLIQADQKISGLRWGLDFAYASSDENGAFSFHPNYRPLMILFSQPLGSGAEESMSVRGASSNNNSLVSVGSNVGNGTGAGAMLTKAHLGYGFDNDNYVLGTDFGYASLGTQGSNTGKKLGFEWDLHLTQKWYENFRTSYALGLLFPGDAFGPNQKFVWGFQVRGGLTF